MSFTFGNRPEDVITDSRGNTLSGVTITLYASEADASAQTSPVGTASSVDGVWSFESDTLALVWARTPAGRVYPVGSADGQLATTEQFLSAVSDEAAEQINTPGTPANDAVVAVAGTASDPATAALVGSASATRDALDSRYPKKTNLEVNVKDHGAIGDNTADDTASIAAAIAAAAAIGPRTRVRFPAVAVGYKVTSTLTIPGKVDIAMDAPIIYAGTGTALVVGETGANRHSRARHLIRVQRATQSPWTDWPTPTVIGVELVNPYWSDIELRDVNGFTVGVKVTGKTAQGASYNTFRLGKLGSNRVHIELDATTGGWVNENKFFGGGFTNATSDPALDRIGVRINSSDGSYYNNANVFYGPSFEIKGNGEAFTGTCVDASYAAQGNKFLDCRHESPDAVAVVTRNSSKAVVFTTAYDEGSNLPTFSDEGTYAGTLVETTQRRSADAAKRLVFKADGLHKRACFYDGGTTTNVPGLHWLVNSAGLDERRHIGSVTINPNYLEWGASRALGLYLSTKNAKRFVVVVDAEAGFGGRLVVRAHDAAGAVLTAAGTVRGDVGTFTATATWGGGGFNTPTDSVSPRFFAVSSSAAYVWVGIGSATTAARLRSFAIYTLDHEGDAATWLPWHDEGVNVGTAAPTAGTWEVGRRVRNVAPAVGSPKGWVCTVAGTPGTWVSEGNL